MNQEQFRRSGTADRSEEMLRTIMSAHSESQERQDALIAQSSALWSV